MGMCKECGEVFGASEMMDGYCINCINNGIKKRVQNKNYISFGWWIVWAWLLIIGNIYLLSIGVLAELNDVNPSILYFTILVIHTVLIIFIFRYNKYAFLITTVLSLNPLLWIINGIYLKNRWNHPKVNTRLV